MRCLVCADVIGDYLPVLRTLVVLFTEECPPDEANELTCGLNLTRRRSFFLFNLELHGVFTQIVKHLNLTRC